MNYYKKKSTWKKRSVIMCLNTIIVGVAIYFINILYANVQENRAVIYTVPVKTTVTDVDEREVEKRERRGSGDDEYYVTRKVTEYKATLIGIVNIDGVKTEETFIEGWGESARRSIGDKVNILVNPKNMKFIYGTSTEDLINSAKRQRERNKTVVKWTTIIAVVWLGLAVLLFIIDKNKKEVKNEQ